MIRHRRVTKVIPLQFIALREVQRGNLRNWGRCDALMEALGREGKREVMPKVFDSLEVEGRYTPFSLEDGRLLVGLSREGVLWQECELVPMDELNNNGPLRMNSITRALTPPEPYDEEEEEDEY